MKTKSKCCRKYKKKKGVACRRCPLLAALALKGKKARKKAS